MPFGAPFLDEAEIVGDIIKIAERSQVLTLKGTAFFALGLVAKTMQGLEILLEHGWDGTTGSMGETLGFCVPVDLWRLLSVCSSFVTRFFGIRIWTMVACGGMFR